MRVLLPKRQGSTRRTRFSDESFRVCDIYLDLPQIRVETCLLQQELTDLAGFAVRSWSDPAPAIIAAGPIQRTLQAGDMRSAAGHHYQEDTAVRIAAAQNCAETTVCTGPAKNGGSFDRWCKASAAHRGSRLSSVALIRTKKNGR